MTRSQFDHSPIFDFLDRHVRDRAVAVRTMEAVAPVLRGAVLRNFSFEPLRRSDLETVRAALQELVGFSVREVRVIPLETLFARRDGESDGDRADRIARETAVIEEAHVDMDEILGLFDAYLEVRVPETVQSDLGEALDAAFKGVEPTHEDPLYLETIEAMAQTFVFVPMLTLCAAAVGDEVVYARAAGFMPWLSRCLPIGALRDEPDVFTVVTTRPLS